MKLDTISGHAKGSQSEDTMTNQSHHEDEERDEIKEIQKLSREDTKRIRIWRMLVTLGLLTTGIAVVVSSYKILSNEEHKNFESAVSAHVDCAVAYVYVCMRVCIRFVFAASSSI
jgi:uncharacterized membrane protein YcjF (UPF0283 family)